MSPVIKLSAPAVRGFWEISVLHEDEHLLAIDKPANLLVSPDRDEPDRPNLMGLLHAGVAEGKPWARERGLSYLMYSHRIDFETSGVLLLAKSKPVLVALADQFGSEKPVRIYTALVQGVPTRMNFEVDAKIGPHPVKAGLMSIDPKNGKKSKTLFEVVETYRRHALVRCQPLTGRAHQIRVHLRHAGHPVVGDKGYHGRHLLLSSLKRDYTLKPGKTERPLVSTPALHSEELRLEHPVTGAEVVIRASWPKDLKVAVTYLQRYARSGGAGGHAGAEE